MKVVNIQGRKKTGKTTTVTNIISELVRRGYSVGSVKGIHIDGFTMDSDSADTGKHKRAGADPVTARCHDETNIMFGSRMNLREILRHYDNDWVVIESHVDLNCPNVVTGLTGEYPGEGRDKSLAEQINELTVACSGVVSNALDEFRGIPVVNSITDIERLVDLIEAAYDNGGEPAISDEDTELPLVETNEFTRVRADGSREVGSDYMLLENSLEIFVNGLYTGTVPCTPQYQVELVLGWLIAEGFINSLQEVSSLGISAEGTRAEVTLGEARRGQFAGNESDRYEPLPVKPISWKKEWIFALAKDFEEILPLRRETMAAHNCRLARGRGDGVEILFKCEDIGRHSAIDKVIGWAVRNGVDMSDCILFTSGRVSREMVKKVIRAGIPVMAGKGTISGRAVQLAKANSLALIGYAGTDSLCIFTD
ncbi:MAG: molybdopterin-guanine dinucleotide biosynthesis protein MobB [Lentihominibacter sp.]